MSSWTSRPPEHPSPPAPARDQKKFAEPVSVSSTAFNDLSLAGSAFELGFDLLRLRARRKWKSRCWTRPLQVLRRRRGRNLRKFNFPHFHSRPCSLWITPPLPRGVRVR